MGTYYLDGLSRTVGDGARTVGYAYDGAGQRTERADARAGGDTALSTFTYGDAGMLASMTSPAVAAGPWTFTYDDAGRPATMAAPTTPGATTTYGFNADDTLATKTLAAGTTSLSSWSYSYDNAYRMTNRSVTDARAGAGPITLSSAFSYDAAGRVSRLVDTAGTRAVSWDHDSNRTGFGPPDLTGRPPQAYRYNADDTLAAGPDPTNANQTPRAHTYDASGRLSGDGCSTYDYDGFDRMVTTIPVPNIFAGCAVMRMPAFYAYDGADRQRSAGPAAGATTMHYDGWGSAVSAEDTGSTFTRFALEPDGTPLGISAGPSFLFDDGQGSVTTVTNADATPACQAYFDPFGTPQFPGSATVPQPPAEGVCFDGAGTPEGVAAYLLFVAEEVRRGLASLGLRTLDEAIGKVECLRPLATDDPRAASMDLTPLITPPDDPDAPRHFVRTVPIQRPRSVLGDRLVTDALLGVFEGDDVSLRYPIVNADRTVGAALGGAIALEWGVRPPMGTAMVRFDGSAGQSFGAFLTHGIEFELVGEANDYVGKGMGGGRVVIRPPDNTVMAFGHAAGGEPVLAGNTCLYGATGGQLFIAGSGGERFGVRNSGATAVVEGVGDHACEYMTGGTVVVLGPVGYNLGAGMTGGQAYVWDPDAALATRLNTSLVESARPEADHLEELLWLIERHHELTGSPRAAQLLADWDATVAHLWIVAPVDEIRRMEAQRAGRVEASA